MSVAIGIVIGAICGLVLLAAFFSGSRTALSATSRARMHGLARRGDRRASMITELIETPERIMGSLRLGTTVVTILAAALATALSVHLSGHAGIVYAALVMTGLILIFGEVLPRTIALVAPDRVALFVAPVLSGIVSVLCGGKNYCLSRKLSRRAQNSGRPS